MRSPSQRVPSSRSIHTGALAAVVPQAGVFELPYLFANVEEADTIIDNVLYDPIAAIMGESQYRGLRIVAIVEIDSLPNLVTNTNIAACAEAQSSGAYVQGVQYALNKLHAIPNVYNYVDAAHHGVVGVGELGFGEVAAGVQADAVHLAPLHLVAAQ